MDSLTETDSDNMLSLMTSREAFMLRFLQDFDALESKLKASHRNIINREIAILEGITLVTTAQMELRDQCVESLEALSKAEALLDRHCHKLETLVGAHAVQTRQQMGLLQQEMDKRSLSLGSLLESHQKALDWGWQLNLILAVAAGLALGCVIGLFLGGHLPWPR